MRLLDYVWPRAMRPVGFIGEVLGAVGGSIVSGLFDKSSAEDQMEFQEEMSSTAHQREVEDLRAAGLNPILSAKYGGASTPGGASWSMPDLGASVSSGFAAAKTKEETKNAQEQRQVIKNTADQLAEKNFETQANTAVLREEFNKKRDERKQIQANTENIRKQNAIMDSAVEAARIESEIDKTAYGKAMRYLNRLNPFANSAKGSFKGK